jgi:hypothetical protein
VERLDIINFCDAAGEWGSILPIPAHEAERMVELADRRKIADLDEPHVQQPRYKDGEELRDRMQPRPGYRGESLHRRQSRSEDREELLDPRLSRFEPQPLPDETRRPLQEVRQPEREDRYGLHNTGVWRGDEYLPPDGRQPTADTRRRRRVSFADDRQYFEVRALRSDWAYTLANVNRMNDIEWVR